MQAQLQTVSHKFMDAKDIFNRLNPIIIIITWAYFHTTSIGLKYSNGAGESLFSNLVDVLREIPPDEPLVISCDKTEEAVACRPQPRNSSTGNCWKLSEIKEENDNCFIFKYTQPLSLGTHKKGLMFRGWSSSKLWGKFCSSFSWPRNLGLSLLTDICC